MARKPKVYDATVSAIRKGMAAVGIRSIAELAKASGIPQSTLNRKMHDSKTFSVQELYLICQCIPVRFLLEVQDG